MGYGASVDYTIIKDDIDTAVSGVKPQFAVKSGAEIHIPNAGNLQSGNYTISSNTTLSNDLIVMGDVTIDSGVTLNLNGYNLFYTGTLTNNGTISATIMASEIGDYTISSDTTLSSNLVVEGDITINFGVTLTTNGYSIICSGTFTNNGTVNAGLNNISSAYNVNIPNSYGGSGGLNYETGTNGYSTLVSGGTSSNYNGSTPSAPTSLTSSEINGWFSTAPSSGAVFSGQLSIQNYLCGASAGSPTLSGAGDGSFGVFIQANEIIAGTINADGGNGSGNSAGGGGGGVILLAYGSGGYTAGTYNVKGGAGGGGGNGGNGQVFTFPYASSPPLPISFMSQVSSSTAITTNSITPISTGRVIVIAEGFKQGTTLDNSVLLVTITNSTTGQQHQFYVGSGQQFYYEFMEDGLSLNTAYTYTFSYQVVSGNAATPLDLIIEAREV